MATRRKDALPKKEKAASSSSQTGTQKLKGAVDRITKANVSAAPKKQTRPTTKVAVTDVSNRQVRKPASPANANKPAQATTKPLVYRPVVSPKPVQKTRVASVAAAAPRSSSSPGKTVASTKPLPGKSLNTLAKDEGKRRPSPPVSNGRRNSIGRKKKEMGTSTSATKEQPQITSLTVDKVEDMSMDCVPEPELPLQDTENSYLAEAEEKMEESSSNIEKGSIDVLGQEIDQESLHLAKIGDGNDHTDSKVVIPESCPVSEEAPLDTKIQEFENKCNLEENSSKQELEHDTEETNSCNKFKKLAVSHEEAGEHEVTVAAEQEAAAAAKKDEAAVVSKADEEIKSPAVENKDEISSLPKQQERTTHGKIDSPVSNNVIEETASKLREQRRNKVKALAGAFETVISLQEK